MAAKTSKLVKISELARLSGVPSPTIKHYMREGLLPPAARKTSRNMAWYDPALVPRIQAIKDLQRERFLPLKVIRELLDGEPTAPQDRTTAEAINRVLRKVAPKQEMTRSQVRDAGADEDDLVWLTGIGLITPRRVDGEEVYSGDDLALLKVLKRARLAGITEQMLPTSILGEYVVRIRELARAELELFRTGVVPQADGNLPELAEAAMYLSEELVIQIRRRALLPALRELVAEEQRRDKS